MAMTAQLQEWVALAFVAAVVALYVYWRRRRPANSCGDCASAGPPPKENVVRFYRRVAPPAPDRIPDKAPKD
jgi:hypothetical protein